MSNIQEWVEHIVAQCGLKGFWNQMFSDLEFRFDLQDWVEELPPGVDNMNYSDWVLERGSWDVSFMDEYVDPGNQTFDRSGVFNMSDALLAQYQGYRSKRLKADKMLKEKLKANGYVQNPLLASQWLSPWSQERRDENGFEVISSLLRRR